MARWSKGRIVAGVLLVIVLGVVIPPFINVSRFRSGIANKIGQAVGREVTIGRVTLQLLPEPGFNLEKVAIADDAAFSAEPVLRADEVTATLRLSSLWRGRLEIGKLSLKYPSANLVRAADGHWNLESLLEQARRIPSAPTAKPRPEARPRFPYIEASGGRINFKSGVEKKVYALVDADFALWLASENEWRVRLLARPFRTDSNLSDTGTVRVNGSFQRARNLRETPLRLRLELERAQLGQLTTLIYGRDRGWRGAVNASVSLNGTPAALEVTTDASVDDFRRYDILSGEALRLEAHCTGAYSTATELFSNVNCIFPFGDGAITARGNLKPLARAPIYDVNVAAQNLPAQSLVVLARHVKKDLPLDLAADGAANATFSFRRDLTGQRLWTGGGMLMGLQLHSRTIGHPLPLGQISFVLDGPSTPPIATARRSSRASPPQLTFPDTGISVRPFTIALGTAAPARAQGRLSAIGYDLKVQGDAQVQRVADVAHGLGLRAPQAVGPGSAKLDIEIAGGWFGFAMPKPTGTVQLRAVEVRLDGIGAPLQISSAELALRDDTATLQKMSAVFGDTHVGFTGWIRLQRGCDSLDECPAQFELQTDQFATDDLNRLFNPRLRRRPWYAVLRSSSSDSLFAHLHATGRITAARMALKSLAARHVIAQLKLEPGTITVSDIRGEIFGGQFRSEGRADFTAAIPIYSTRGRLERVSMSQIATAMHDDWATGAADISYQGTASGWNADDLAASAAGLLQFDWRDGALAHLGLKDMQPPLRLHRFAGRMNLRNGMLELSASRMETPAGIYKVSGTASLTRQLELKLLGDGSQGYTITGPLEKPLVAPATAPATSASLQR